MASLQSDNHQLDDPLQAALADDRRRQAQMSALLEAARAVLDYREFRTAARFVYESCKKAIKASAGYVALLSKEGTENEVLFLDSGGIDCTVDPALPMPIRGLRREAYLGTCTVYENDFCCSEWHDLLPDGHVVLDNVLFAPLLVDGKAVGVLGLANKPGGFTEEDASLATAFGELCALALLNSQALESLHESRERFRAVAQTAHDAIITIDAQGKIVFWNRAAEEMFGYPAGEMSGQPLTTIVPERFRQAHRDGLHRLVSTGEAHLLQQTVRMVGVGRGRGEFPIELSLGSWQLGGEPFFTGIVRDITARVQAEEEIRSLARFPSENLSPVLRITHAGTVLYANQASAPLLATWDTQVGRPLPEAWRERIAGVARSGDGQRIELLCRDRIFSIDLVPVEGAPYVNLYGHDVTARRQAEAGLRQAHDELERRVRERTAELARANDELRAEIAERIRVEEALRVQSAIARSLSDASTALTQTLELDTVLDTLLDYLGGLVPYDRACAMLPQDGARFVIRAARGRAGQADAQRVGCTVSAANHPLLQQLADAKECVLLSDAGKHVALDGLYSAEAIRSWLGVSLRSGDRVIGLCVVGKVEAGFYTSQHIQLAGALASQASVAVQNAWLFDQVRAGRERLQFLSRRLVEVQETERRYVARELHDDASQALASLMVDLRLLEQDAADPHAVAARAGALRRLVDSVIGDLHRLAMDLCPASLDHLGLVAALRQYLQTVRNQHELKVEYEVVGLETRLPADVETAIYRVVQEAVTNVVRHARATRVDVLLECRGSELIVLIEDDGIGFDPASAGHNGRLGLFGMRERAEMLGARLAVESVANSGTTILMEVPLVD
jgi:PAS domain S-box-containing protein